MERAIIQPSAEELVLCKDPAITCETYLFEPSPEETALGFLFVAGEIESRNGIGKQLLDTVISAVQQEYYREPARSCTTSFEMALHQANLILHDTAEAGTRDWMGHFHVAIGVLANDQLHISVAGGGAVFLARKSQVTNISQGLSHFPITNPLKTFSQVASGSVLTRDALFFASSTFESLFKSVDIGRFSLEHSASTISSRLEQLYLDQDHAVPLAVTVVTLLPNYIGAAKQEIPRRSAERVTDADTTLQPRVPLIIKRTIIQQIIVLLVSGSAFALSAIKKWLWPFLKQGSKHSGRAIINASKTATKKVSTLKMPRMSITSTVSGISRLPSSSKLFAVIAVILLIALAGSIILLQHKRVSDQVIQTASEQLHEAQTKLEGAKTAIIYDNRGQAQGLLADANNLAQILSTGTLYIKETQALKNEITIQQDRLQKIVRTNSAISSVVGDVSELTKNKAPKRIFTIDGTVYTANSDTNAILKISADKKIEEVNKTTSGIGFISSGAVQSSDKTILYTTDPVGLALFDTKDNSLSSQTITFPAGNPVITDLASFGNRLYIYDTTKKNIFSYNKTLRGFVGGTPWITDTASQKSDIVSIAIDGNIYALSKTGNITKLFRGAPTDFTQAVVDPPLTSAERIITSDTMQNLYVLDTKNKRVVVFTKKGALVRQILVDNATSLTDIAITPDEAHLYALDGTKIIDVLLVDPASASPSPLPTPKQ